MRFLPIILLGLLLDLGCRPPTTTVTTISQKSFPTKPEGCDIQILTQLPTNRKYEEIAILNTVSGDDGQDLNFMLPSIKATACRCGADAVVIKNVEPGQPTRPGSGKAYTVAIKYLD